MSLEEMKGPNNKKPVSAMDWEAFREKMRSLTVEPELAYMVVSGEAIMQTEKDTAGNITTLKIIRTSDKSLIYFVDLKAIKKAKTDIDLNPPDDLDQ